MAKDDGIHVGKDGWLFVIAGSNNVVAQFNESDYMSHQAQAWRGLILARRERAQALGIVYRHLVVPEKLSVYDHFLDGLAIDHRLSPIRRMMRGAPRRRLVARLRAWRRTLVLRRACIDLLGRMRSARFVAPLFHRTDSHWNFAGCHLAYRAVCASLRASPRDDFPTRASREKEFSGDLGSRFDPPRTETGLFHDLQRDAVRIQAGSVVLAREAAGTAHTLHVGAQVVYRNAASRDRRRLVLFGDSYSHFAPTQLTIMLAETFFEVHFIWSSSIDWAYVERVRPDILLTQIAERFMFHLPDDAFDLDAYAADRYGAEIGAVG